MNIEGVEKKLREARFALDQMIEQDRMADSKEEQFDLYLSGLLAAGMSVRNAFHVEQDRKRNEAVKKWKSDWEARLSPEERCLWNFMREDRNHEVHRSGSSRTMKIENREFRAGTHKLADGTMHVTGAPGFDRVTIHAPGYYFTIDDVERKATEACEEYLGLLQQMVAAFKADHPQS
jgi:hypothetical protein